MDEYNQSKLTLRKQYHQKLSGLDENGAFAPAEVKVFHQTLSVYLVFVRFSIDFTRYLQEAHTSSYERVMPKKTTESEKRGSICSHLTRDAFDVQ